MINLIELIMHKRGKLNLPNSGIEYRIVFKKGSIETIMKAKGWKTMADMARELCLTRAYVSMLANTRVRATSTVIARLAAVMGNVNKNWWIHFEIVPWGMPDNNHPVWNQEKYMGQIPYNQYSSAAEMRKLDYRAESLGDVSYTEKPRKIRSRKNLKKKIDMGIRF